MLRTSNRDYQMGRRVLRPLHCSAQFPRLMLCALSLLHGMDGGPESCRARPWRGGGGPSSPGQRAPILPSRALGPWAHPSAAGPGVCLPRGFGWCTVLTHACVSLQLGFRSVAVVHSVSERWLLGAFPLASCLYSTVFTLPCNQAISDASAVRVLLNFLGCIVWSL